MKVVFDTNIIIDYLVQRGEHYEQSKQVFNMNLYGIVDGYITPVTLTTVAFILERQGITTGREELEKLIKIFHILDTNEDDCYNANRSDITDFEDSLIVESALRVGVENIVTRNGKDFINGEMIVYTPDELIHKFEYKSES